MKNFAALLATIASVHAVQLGAEAEAEAQFGIESFFSKDELIPQFLGSGTFLTEDLPTGIYDVIDSDNELEIYGGADFEEDDQEEEDDKEDDDEEDDDFEVDDFEVDDNKDDDED